MFPIFHFMLSCTGILYGGCLGLEPPSAKAVKSILPKGDWLQISGAKNRKVASFHWAVTKCYLWCVCIRMFRQLSDVVK